MWSRRRRGRRPFGQAARPLPKHSLLREELLLAQMLPDLLIPNSGAVATSTITTAISVPRVWKEATRFITTSIRNTCW
jgi:hypothetical protein